MGEAEDESAALGLGEIYEMEFRRLFWLTASCLAPFVCASRRDGRAEDGRRGIEERSGEKIQEIQEIHDNI